MTLSTLLFAVLLAFFGLNISLVAWIILRTIAGATAAMLGFYTTLIATCYGILQLIA